MRINWYFDYISPFAYIQLSQLEDLQQMGHTIEYRPVLFAGLLDHWQNLGPAELPPKRTFTYQYCCWLAHSKNLPFKMPPAHPFNPLAALRLTIACDNSSQLIRAIFNKIWAKGEDISSPAFWQSLIDEFSLTDIESMIANQEVKQTLRSNTERAAAENVFGVPTLQINGQNFWGVDAFAMALHYLRDPDWFASPEFQRLQDLPQGVQRKK